MSDNKKKQAQSEPNDIFTYTRNRLWECMKTALAHNLFCLAYTSSERAKLKEKVKRYNLVLNILPFVLFILLVVNMLVQQKEIPVWISVAVALVNVVLSLSKNAILQEELHRKRMDEIDNLGKNFKTFYTKFSDIFIDNFLRKSYFDCPVNDTISKLRFEQEANYEADKCKINDTISKLINEQDDKINDFYRLTDGFIKGYGRYYYEEWRRRAEYEMKMIFFKQEKD